MKHHVDAYLYLLTLAEVVNDRVAMINFIEIPLATSATVNRYKNETAFTELLIVYHFKKRFGNSTAPSPPRG